VICINILVLCNVDLENKWGDYTRVFSLMGALTKRGYKIFIFVIRSNPKTPRISSFKENGINVIEIHPPSIGFSGKKGISRHLNYLACIPTIQKEASKIISKHKIDYLYSYMPGTGSSIPAMRLSSKHKIPLILDLADMYTMIRPKMVIEKSFKKADKIMVITNYLKNDLMERGILESKIHIIPNGVDLDLFNLNASSDEQIKKTRESFQSDKIVIFSGSLQDLSIIINSAKYVIEQIPDVKFVIIGDHRDPQRSKSIWEKKVQEKNMSKNFIFLGKLPQDEIPKYILSADVCVDSFPNEPYYAAAHPIKLLEYGACGKPVVATRVSETEKIIKHNVYGLLAEPSNSSEFAEYLITLLNSNELRQKMGKNFLDFVKTNFSWEKITDDLQKTLKH
jgi:glycosyltransferase involved in cell wall biosynthesis